MAMSAFNWATRVVATAVVATDGTGDFTNIQAAIDSLPAGGGVVYVKEGTYTITEGLLISSDNIVIIGAGRSTIIQTTANIRLFSVSGDYFKLENVFLKGNNQGFGQDGVTLTSSTRSIVVGCWIEDMGANGVAVLGSDDVIIAHNFIKSNSGVGIVWTTNPERVLISGNSIVDNGDYGLRGTGLLKSVIDSNIIKSNSENGIDFTACDNNIISNNFIDGHTAYGIDINDAASDENIITSNQITNNTTAAIKDDGTGTIKANNITS